MPTSLEEVLKLDITYAAEYGDSYYFQPQSDDKFDHCMWKVNKKSVEVSYFDMIEFIINIADDAVTIDPNSIRGVSHMPLHSDPKDII